MDVEERVRRRLTEGARPLVVDRAAMSPVTHLRNPVGRGGLTERLLDHLDPALDGHDPGDAYLWGPRGTGKSAVVTALFDHLAAQVAGSAGAGTGGRATREWSVIHTTTRSRPSVPTGFVYLDTRAADSEFALYRGLLRGLTDEAVPEGGIGTERLVSRLREHLDPTRRQAVVALDHVGEPGTADLGTVRERLEPVTGAVSLLAVGRDPPASVTDAPGTTVRVGPYERHALVDVVSERADLALAGRALAHADARRIAEACEGDAGDALAVLFEAADRASLVGADHVRERDVTDTLDSLARPGVALGRVLSLPANRQRVLYALLELETPPDSVGETAEAVAARLSLSPGTVRRFLYELAEEGIVERVSARGTDRGRPPSRVVPCFPTGPFRRLYED